MHWLVMSVTPHVGVWIETLNVPQNYRAQIVTPHVGVWIETYDYVLGSFTTTSHLM